MATYLFTFAENCFKDCSEMDLIQVGELAVAFLKNGSICFVSCKEYFASYFRVYGHLVDGLCCESVSCLGGHRQSPIFAFGDRTARQPRIIVLSYPEKQFVASLRSDGSLHSANGEYKCIQFSQTEHIVALRSFPSFEIEVWNWRTKTLMLTHKTEFCFDDQYIR